MIDTPLEPWRASVGQVSFQSVTTALVVDDEPQIRRAVRSALRTEVERTLEAATGEAGIGMAAGERPDVILLDLGLPDLEGEHVCREIRKWSTVPIIVLSARHSDVEKAALLDAGADDYITKPFSTVELQARVRAHLRRARQSGAVTSDQPFTVGTLTIDMAKPSLLKAGQPVHLTRIEWDLLRALVRHSGRTLTHRQLYQSAWGNAHGDMQQYLRVYIRSLRQKLEMDPVRPAVIVTEPGVGYRLEPGTP